MRARLLLIITIISGLNLLVCELPPPPPGPEGASVNLGFELPSGEQVKGNSLVDTTGNQVKICMFLNLTQYLDSVVLKITMGADYAKSYSISNYADLVTTATYPIIFTNSGNYTVTLTGYAEGELRTASGIITIVDRPQTNVNRAPEWISANVEASAKVGTLFSYDLSGKCNDPDKDSLTFSLITESPANDTIIGSKYTFTPAGTDTGKHTIHIVARDLSGLEDTLTIELTVSSDSVVDTKPPVFTRVSPANDSAKVSSSTILVSVLFSDESKVDSVKCFIGTTSFNIVKTGDSLYNATISGLVAGWNTVTFTARDASPAKNPCTLLVHIKYEKEAVDKVPPIITVQSPSKDTIISADSFEVKVTCVDDSSISSVKGYRDTTYFALERSLSVKNVWTGVVKGISSRYSTVKIVAADSSAAKNKDSATVRIKYDNDKSGPVIALVNPLKDSVTTSATSYTIMVKCTDLSGVLSLNGTSGAKAFTGVRDTGSIWEINVSALEANKVTPIVLTAIDSSLGANKTLDTLFIRNEIINSYTITFDKNDAAATGVMPVKTVKSGTAVSLDSVTFLKAGWTFAGWASSSGGDVVYVNGGNYTMGTGDVMLFAKWKQNAHTVSFIKNDSAATGTMPAQTIAEGVKVNLTANAFVKPGWNFAGWATSSAGNAVYANQDDYTMGTSDVTLYAKWTPAELTITFDKNDINATGNMTPQTVTSGSLVPLKANSFQKTGWTFAGWAISSSDTVTYADQGNFRMGTGNITLFAKWAPKMFTITFNGNGIDGFGFMGPQNIACGSSEKLKRLTYSISCQTFVGWATTPNGAAEYGDQAEYKMGTSDVTLYAIWKLTPLVVNPSADKKIETCIKNPITVTISGCATSYEWHYIAWGQDEIVKNSLDFSGQGTATLTIITTAGMDVYCNVKDSAGTIVKSGTWTAGPAICQK